jgi:hypothetical protein
MGAAILGAVYGGGGADNGGCDVGSGAACGSTGGDGCGSGRYGRD